MFVSRSLAVAALSVVGFAACAEQSVDTAPEATIDTLDEQDEGTSWNGWEQSGSGEGCVDWGQGTIRHTFTRSFGDPMRGGGGCLVFYGGDSCSSDALCTSHAQNVWGSQAYGYCYSGACWYRAGSQASDCALSPNRTAGTLTKSVSTAMGYGYGVLGCMTKTSGPNTACGGTNTSLYVRTISGFTSTNCD